MERPITLQILFYKKKKKVEQDVAKVTMEHVPKKIRVEKYPLVYYDCKPVIYFIFLQMIEDYYSLG